MYPKAWNNRLGDGHWEAKTPLCESVGRPLSHLEKNIVLAAVHFASWQNGYNTTCLFSQLSVSMCFGSASGALFEEHCMVQHGVLGNQTDV